MFYNLCLFSERELKTVRSVASYYKSLVDEAEDDVDRLLISEGELILLLFNINC